MISNVNRLISQRMATVAIPKGGGLQDGVNFLLDKKRVVDTAREARIWVGMAISVVRSAQDPNPWKSSSDEEIAGELLRLIEARRRKV